MKRLNIQLTSENYERLARAAEEAHNSRNRMAELYIMRGLDHLLESAQPAEIDDLVAAAQGLANSLPDCTIEWAQSGGLDNTNAAVIMHWRDKVRAALAPFQESSDD